MPDLQAARPSHAFRHCSEQARRQRRRTPVRKQRMCASSGWRLTGNTVAVGLALALQRSAVGAEADVCLRLWGGAEGSVHSNVLRILWRIVQAASAADAVALGRMSGGFRSGCSCCEQRNDGRGLHRITLCLWLL